MAQRVTESKVISIDGKLYRLRNRVAWGLVSGQPPKLVIGDYNEQTNPRASSVSWTDLSGGIGVETMDVTDPAQHKRAWYATANLRHDGQVILPGRDTVTAQAAATDVDALPDYGNQMYKCHATTVYLYDLANDTNTSSRTLLNSVTDWARGLVGGTDTLVLATGSECDYLQGSTWARNTTDIKYVVFLDELLWGIDIAGQLYYTDDLSAGWSTDALLQLPSGSVTGLITAWGDDNKRHIYAGTRVGIYAHNALDARFEPTGFAELPYHPQGGTGASGWRGAIAYPAGSGMHLVGFSSGSPVGVADVAMGPDRDHGLPSTRRGNIVATASSHNELFAALNGTIGSGWWTLSPPAAAGAGSSRISTFGASKGYSTILAWSEIDWRKNGNRGGWQVTWESGATDKEVTAITVSNSFDSYRLWWASNRNVYTMPIPADVVNPLKVTSSEYGETATIDYPWYTAGTPNTDKLALSTVLETSNPSTGETVTVTYALNFDDTTWYSTGHATPATATGQLRYYFGANRAGIVYRAIKYRVVLARAAANIRSTPILRLLGLSYRQRIRRLYGIRAPLDVKTEDAADGRNAQQQLSDLRAVMNNGALVEVVWRSDDGDLQNYYMDPEDLIIEEESGFDYGSQVDFVALEPEQSTAR